MTAPEKPQTMADVHAGPPCERCGKPAATAAAWDDLEGGERPDLCWSTADSCDDAPGALLRRLRDGTLDYDPDAVAAARAMVARLLADGSLSLGDLGATQTLPECTCIRELPENSRHSESCAIEQTEWWRIPEGGER